MEALIEIVVEEDLDATSVVETLCVLELDTHDHTEIVGLRLVIDVADDTTDPDRPGDTVAKKVSEEFDDTDEAGDGVNPGDGVNIAVIEFTIEPE